jgi:hypothetical protein
MANIVITEQQRAALTQHSKLWISRALRTEPANEQRIVRAIKDLYKVSNLADPAVVLVSSPVVASVAGGMAAGLFDNENARPQSAANLEPAVANEQIRALLLRTVLPDFVVPWARPIATAIHRLIDVTGGEDGKPVKITEKSWRYVSNWFALYQGGSMWINREAYITACRDILNIKLPVYAAFEPWERAAIEGGPRMVHEKFAMVCDFPAQINIDDQFRPHNTEGPSFAWRDNFKVYHVHGIRIEDWIIESPEKITVAAIGDETNAEIRRIMIDKFPGGIAEYIKASGTKKVDHDERWGTLHRKEVPDDEAIQMLECVNRTPEPDGSFKHYFLRVPPDVRTSHQAVAWTFNMTTDEYHPEAES